MAICVQSIIKRKGIESIIKYSTAAKPSQVLEESSQFFRTSEDDPRNHTERHLYRYYTIPNDHKKQLFQFGGITRGLAQQMTTFSEHCLMVRKPAIEILSYLRQADYTKPVIKYVIYGEKGSGKSCTLMHLLHYGFVSNQLLVHVPWVLDLFQYPKEFAPSTTRPNFWNLPVDAATWLMNFKHQNYNLINQPQFKLTKSYEWGPNEKTEAGRPLIELIDLGINRIKYASDIIVVLMDEIKAASNAGICQTLVVIDGFNGFFTDYTRIKNDLKEFVPANQITLTLAFLNITKSDWRNGAIILTADQIAQKKRRASIYPRYLLSKEGFEHIDPFVPILVENYNNIEFENNMEYFKNRKWIRDISPQGFQEMNVICKSNPLSIREYCKFL